MKLGIRGNGKADHMTAHGLRAPMISMLISAGYSDAAVALRSGHRDNTSLQSYQNLRGLNGEAQPRAVFSEGRKVNVKNEPCGELGKNTVGAVDGGRGGAVKIEDGGGRALVVVGGGAQAHSERRNELGAVGSEAVIKGGAGGVEKVGANCDGDSALSKCAVPLRTTREVNDSIPLHSALVSGLTATNCTINISVQRK